MHKQTYSRMLEKRNQREHQKKELHKVFHLNWNYKRNKTNTNAVQFSFQFKMNQFDCGTMHYAYAYR